MPDHPHLVVSSAEPELDRLRLARLLGHFGHRFGAHGKAAEVPAPSVIRPAGPLARQIRYVALNPCRAGIVSCPLAWLRSTHRDVVGASIDPWVTPERLAKVPGVGAAGFFDAAAMSVRAHADHDGRAQPKACARSAPTFNRRRNHRSRTRRSRLRTTPGSAARPASRCRSRDCPPARTRPRPCCRGARDRDTRPRTVRRRT